MFSKSRLGSANICLKKAWLEKHRKDLAKFSERTEAAFRVGNEVGEIAKEIYGTPGAYEIPLQRKRMQRMVNETEDLLASGFREPIFEGTFRHQGVLVRVDVLLPVEGGWRAIEIKSSRSIQDYHRLDCAIQLWVMRGAGLDVTSMSLGYLDRDFIYQGDGNYRDLIIEEELTASSDAMAPEVEALIARATEAVRGECPNVNVGMYCEEPFDCAFAHHCWPSDTKYPIRNIGGDKEKKFEWVSRGFRDITDVPLEEVSGDRQTTIRTVSESEEPWLVPGAKAELKKLGYPRYHLDFETTSPAIPVWKGSKPGQLHAVQFSIHVDDGTGDGSLESTEHIEFLDLSGNPPMRPLAEALIEKLGAEGPIFMWHHYEKTVINGLIKLFPDLEPKLKPIVKRLVDLKTITARYYYHPDMQGSYSIKDVAPTVNSAYDYKLLSGINEGNAAADGFLEAINPSTTAERKAELEEQLLRYCKFDTEAMVEIAKFLSDIEEVDD